MSLTYDPQLSRVRVAVSALPSGTATATVERSVDQVRWSTVRGTAARTPTAGGVVAVDDYEFTPDVVNYYRVRAFDADGAELGGTLNSNPYVEADASNWTTLGGTGVRSTAQAHEGAASLLLTPDGVSTSARTLSEEVPAAAGQTFRVSAWVRCAVARSVEIRALWNDASHVLLSLSQKAVSVAAGTWTLLDGSFTAPAGTVWAQLQVWMGSTPPASHLLHIDEATLAPVTAGPVFTAQITPAIGGVWLKSVARPFLNRQVTVVDYSDVERSARGGTFDVVGRSLPVSVSDVRGSRRWTLEVLTNTPDEADDLDLLLASGDTLLIQAPAGSSVPGGYVEVGDTRQRRTSRLGPRRVFELPCTEVAAPGPDVVGAAATWQTVLNTYPTWQAVLDAHDSWQSLMELVGDPTDVVVP